jgi:hypothetical protein
VGGAWRLCSASTARRPSRLLRLHVNGASIQVALAGNYGVFALTFRRDFVPVILADVVLPRHRDVVVFQQDRGRRHAVVNVLEEVFGPEGVFVGWVNPGTQTWKECE